MANLSSGKPPIFILGEIHDIGESLTALSVDTWDEKMITADTKGRFKLWDISACDFKDKSSHADQRKKIRMCWYI